MTLDVVGLEDVKRLRLQEGDVLVLRIDDLNMTHAQLADIAERMRNAFPDHKTVVLTKGMEFQVVEKPA